MSKINLASVPANLIDCIDPFVKPIWDYLPRDSQIHELEKARETLEWREGTGKTWCELVENCLATQASVKRHYMRQLFGRTLSIEELVDYLCAEHGMTRPQALGMTSAQVIESLRVACQKKGPTHSQVPVAGGSGAGQQKGPADETASPARTPAVVLGGYGDRPTVRGRSRDPLTRAQHDVVTSLVEAGERGLSKDELSRQSKRGDARRILKRLAASDPDWRTVIHFAVKPGRGYRIG